MVNLTPFDVVRAIKIVGDGNASDNQDGHEIEHPFSVSQVMFPNSASWKG